MSAQLTPASRSEATGILRALFEAFPADRGDGVGAAATYLIAVEGFSMQAISMAVKRFIKGQVPQHDMRFLPTPPQVATVVRHCEYLISPPEPRKALPAPGQHEPTEAERLRVADKVRQWVKDRTPEGPSGFKPREPGDIVREMREKQFTLSPAALATFTKDHLDTIAVDDPGTSYEAYAERERNAA